MSSKLSHLEKKLHEMSEPLFLEKMQTFQSAKNFSEYAKH